MTTRCALGGLLVLGSVAPGCNQADPVLPGETDTDTPTVADTGPGTPVGTTGEVDTTASGGSATDGPQTDGSDTADTEPSGDPDYYPLVDGATWTYRHTTSQMTVWDEIVTMEQTTWNGETAFEARDNAGTNGESTSSILMRIGTAVHRVHKDVDLAGVPVLSADYDPGFLRFDNGWEEGESLVWNYERTEYDAMGAIVDLSDRNHIFTVESMSVEVTVPAGTFECVQFLRERLETGEVKRFWFADGVGKIKHETLSSGATEELAEFSIP